MSTHDGTYQAPALSELGGVASLTAGAATGDAIDADFPANTPTGDLTFY